MLDVYYAATPNGWKVTILLAELEEAGKAMEHNLIPVNLTTIGKNEDYLKISPNGRMPAIVDHDGPDGKPLSCFESAAIMMYLDEKAGNHFLSADPREKYEQLQWLYWVQGGLGPMGGQLSHFVNYASHVAPDKDHSYSHERYANEYNRLISVMERELSSSGRAYLGSDSIGLADMAAFPWIVPYKRFGVDLTAYPMVRAWFTRVKSRPGVKRGMDVLRSTVRVGGAGMSDEQRKALFSQGGDPKARI